MRCLYFVAAVGITEAARVFLQEFSRHSRRYLIYPKPTDGKLTGSEKVLVQITAGRWRRWALSRGCLLSAASHAECA